MIDSVKKPEGDHKRLHLEKVTGKNYPEIIALSIKRNQHLLSNIESMAYAYTVVSEGNFAEALGLYHVETPVGYAMIGRNICLSEGTETFGRSYDL